MKRIFCGVLVLAVVCAFLAGPAQAQAPARPDWKEGLRVHDKNQDGKIDRAEFQEWVVDMFYHKDAGHKGYLVYEDVKDVMSAETFKGRDTNGNGKLTLQEYLNALFQDFAAIDVNQNGAITAEEIEAYIKQTRK